MQGPMRRDQNVGQIRVALRDRFVGPVSSEIVWGGLGFFMPQRHLSFSTLRIPDLAVGRRQTDWLTTT